MTKVTKTARETPPERVFEDGPWAQKWMDGSDKKAAFEAAWRGKKTMTVWLGEAIRAKVAEERTLRAVPPGATGVVTLDAHDGANGTRLLEPIMLTADEIARCVQVYEQILEKRGKTLRPNARVLVEAERTIRAKLRINGATRR